MAKEIKKIAIANRGEIAVRLISTCLEMGKTPVLLYSSADKNSLAYRLSPEKICIGSAEPQKSYLNVSAVVEGALKAKAEAIHPGYGFLSENPAFALACEKHNIVFIGPSASALKVFGDKVKARKLAIKCGLPVLPAITLPIEAEGPWPLFSHVVDLLAQNLNKHKVSTSEQGLPFVPADSAVIIKAIGGGGGRGLRVVHSEKEWEGALQSAQREAKLAFGSSGVFVEKYLPLDRHIEVQVFVSAKGEAVYLFDRDCSIQRKHQKIIEEAPACLPSSVRKEMAEASLALLSSVGYRQAGTVEFLYQGGKFYFMEVNPRIQVECPVTEMILGVDLIKAQILTAEGREPFFQKSFEPRGHSLQCRIYAEDMIQQVPVVGQLGSCYFPHGVYRRFDMGYESKDYVPSFYDSMLGKLIVHGENRAEARQKMQQALRDTLIFGLKTNLSFLQSVISHQKFIKGDVHTRFVEEELLPQITGETDPDDETGFDGGAGFDGETRSTGKSHALADNSSALASNSSALADNIYPDVNSLDPSVIDSVREAFADSSKKESFNPWTYFAK